MHHPTPLRLCAALVLAIPAVADATPGAPLTVPIVLTPIESSNDTADAVAYEQDGTFLVVGWADNGSNKTDFAFARYTASAALDTGFTPPPPSPDNSLAPGTGITEVGASSSEAHAVLAQPDGNVLLVGQAVDGSSGHWDFVAARYDADGNLDTNFNAGQPADLSTGKIDTPIGPGDAQAYAAALQGDGMLIAAGTASNGSNNDFALVRYTSSGIVDTSFGNNGIVTTDLGAHDDVIEAVAVQPDGKIVAAGYTCNSGTICDIAVARYTAGGQLDTGFNAGGAQPGVVTTDFSGGNDYAYALALQADGKIVVAGRTGQSFAVVRYNTDGGLDAGFDGGKIATPIGSAAAAYAVLIQPDGAVLLGGTDGSNFALARYTTAGQPDPAFGTNGIVTSSAGTGSGTIKALALSPDGSVVAAGYANNARGNLDFAVARYTAVDTPWDLIPDAFSFTDPGVVSTGYYATSNTVTIGGLGSGVIVPVLINNGQYRDPVSQQYNYNRGWVGNGDALTVRQLAVAGTTTTTLTVGGIAPPNNDAAVVGTVVSAAFTSTGVSGDGSGALGPAAVLAAAAALWMRPRRRHS